MIKRYALLLCFFLLSTSCFSNELRIAVASNFKATAELIANDFSKKTNHKVTIITGSSSALLTLISNGAPFDVFLSADKMRPIRLIKQGLAIEKSLFNYANGQLVFLSNLSNPTSIKQLKTQLMNQTGKLAIANPKLAPYGSSSKEFLIKNNIYPSIKANLIKGNNIIQAMQFVLSKNAESGFISYSQILQNGINQDYFLMPQSSYPAIKQYGVITKRGSVNIASSQFMAFLQHDSKDIISSAGYLLSNIDE